MPRGGGNGHERYNPFRDEQVEHFPDLEEAFGPTPVREREREEESLWSPESQAVLYGEEFSLHNDTADANHSPEALLEEETAALEYWESHAFTRTPLGPQGTHYEGKKESWVCSTPLGDVYDLSTLLSPHGPTQSAQKERRGGRACEERRRKASALSEVDKNTFCVRDLLERSREAPSSFAAPPRPTTPPYDDTTAARSPPGESRHAPRTRLQHSPSAQRLQREREKERREERRRKGRDTRRREEKDPSLPLELRTLLLLQRVERELNAL